jgi:hypothetical protein
MFLIWLLWLTIVAGGFYLGVGYGIETWQNGGVANALNALIYCGCAIYASPKLAKLLFKKS